MGEADAIAVVTGDAGFGTALVAALERRIGGGVVELPARDSVPDATTALAEIDQLAAVVHVCGDDAALQSSAITSTDLAAWEVGCERVVWRVLTSLQAAHAALSRRQGGRVVLVTATAGVSGAPGSVPLVAAIEGARSMAKSAARQWGSSGISVNCVSVPLGLLAPSHADQVTFLPPAARSREHPFDDIARAVAFLSGPDADGISGATLLVDGGAVMAP